MMKHHALTERIIKVFYTVYNEMGHGFLESVYENAMRIALAADGLSAEQQVAIPVFFRGVKVGDFRCDLLVEGTVILELKAVRELTPEHVAQTLNYLRATEVEVALVLNFSDRPTVRRLVYDNERKTLRGSPDETMAAQ